MKIFYFFASLFLLVFCTQNANAQKWHWVDAAVNISNSIDESYDLTTDRSGNIFETGYITWNGGVNFGSINVSTNAATGAYLVKFDNTGNAIWGVTVSGTDNNFGSYGTTVATDKHGNACFGGNYTGAMAIGSFTYPFSSNFGSGFIAMFSPSGSFKWGAYLQGGDQTGVNSIAIDDSGYTYITGMFGGADSVSFGQFKLFGENGSFYLAKLDTSGNFIWVKTAKAINTNIGSYGCNVVTDDSDNAYVMGDFKGGTLTIENNTIASKSKSFFLAKFNSSGNLIWIRQPATNSATSSAVTDVFLSYNGGRYLCIDTFNNLYITGLMSDTVEFGGDTLIAHDSTIFLAKYNSLGNLVWVTESSPVVSGYYPWDAVPHSITCNNSGDLYTCGTFFDSLAFGSIKLSLDTTLPSSYLYKFDTSGKAICCSANLFYSVAANPLNTDVFFSGTAHYICYIGNFLVTGNPDYSFLGEWSCIDCSGVLNDSITHTNITCNGANNGSATFYVSGGMPVYSYTWSPRVSFDSIANNLSAGNYTVTVIDNSGCSSSSSVTITAPAPLSVTQGLMPDTSLSGPCNGKAWVTVGGGTPAYTYLWSPGGETTDTIENQCAGTYCCKVTDNNGCIDSACLVITAVQNINNLPSVSIYPDPNKGNFTVAGIRNGQVIALYNNMGQLLTEMVADNPSMQLNISDKANGIYLVRILNRNGSLVMQKKIVKIQ